MFLYADAEVQFKIFSLTIFNPLLKDQCYEKIIIRGVSPDRCNGFYIFPILYQNASIFNTSYDKTLHFFLETVSFMYFLAALPPILHITVSLLHDLYAKKNSFYYIHTYNTRSCRISNQLLRILDPRFFINK